MEPFTKLESTAVVLDIAKIDTGMILPGRFMRMPRRPGEATYANAFLHDLRFDADGRPRTDCVLNDPGQRAARPVHPEQARQRIVGRQQEVASCRREERAFGCHHDAASASPPIGAGTSSVLAVRTVRVLATTM